MPPHKEKMKIYLFDIYYNTPPPFILHNNSNRLNNKTICTNNTKTKLSIIFC